MGTSTFKLPDRVWSYNPPTIDVHQVMGRYRAKTLLEQGIYHSKLVTRAHLEESGLPLNQQLSIRFGDIAEFETILDYCIDGWWNIGISTLLTKQNALGSTPYVPASPFWKIRGQWQNVLSSLSDDVRRFRAKHRGKQREFGIGGLHTNDVLRCYPSPIGLEGYRGITVHVPLHQVDDLPQRVPFSFEIFGAYPRKMHNALPQLVLTGEANRYGNIQIANKSNLGMLSADNEKDAIRTYGTVFNPQDFTDVVPTLTNFMARYSSSIIKLGLTIKADIISFDMEYDSIHPPHIRVFDYDAGKIPFGALVVAESLRNHVPETTPTLWGRYTNNH